MVNIHFGIPLTHYIFQLVVSPQNPLWVRVYYKYQIKDTVIGLTGEIPNSDFQALGLDFDDNLTLEELRNHVKKYKEFVLNRWNIDLGRAWIFETSKRKYYVWFLDSRLEYRCYCPTIINLSSIDGLKADDNYVMWLQRKKSCVMRISPKKFQKVKPRLIEVIGEKKEIPKDQFFWQERFLEMAK
jgi:hypothetical protein